MLEAKTVITESLAPAVAMTGIALMLNGLQSRFSTAATRVRELNRELRKTTQPNRIENIKQQIPLFMHRAYLVRNSMFILFGSMGMMVLTTVSIALSRLEFLNWEMVPVWSFMSGLALMLLAVVIEAYETMVNLRTLELDVDHSVARAMESSPDDEM